MTSTSSDFAAKTLIACAAAAVSTLLVLRLTSSNDEDDSHPPPPFHTTFHGRTHMKGSEGENIAFQSRGFSMEEAMAKAQVESDKKQEMTPLEILQGLQKGNCRFWTGNSSRPEISAFERRALINKQHPSTAILGCADSRVPVEIVFDQGFGDMFVVRVAGNCLGLTTEASMEKAVHHLHVKVMVIMGHEGCGAIKASQLPLEVIEKESKNLSFVLKELKAGLADHHISNIFDARARDRELVAYNVKNQVEKLTQDKQIMKVVNDGSLIIVGAFYEISSGIVDFFMQVSAPDKDMKPSTGVQSRFDPVTKEIIYA